MGGYDGLIGVVGNCAAGKTTLVKGLTSRGFHAVNVAQEHSTAPRLWQRKNPDFLVCLSCTLETAKQRRDVHWGQDRLNEQRKRLAHALVHCNLILPTDGLTVTEVLDTVVEAVTENTN